MIRFTIIRQTVPCPGLCGGKCGGELVAAVASSKAKTVRFAACSALIAQGWRGHQLAAVRADAGRYGVIL